MRHFLSLVLGLFLAPLMWALTAWSTYRFFVATADAHPISDAGGELVVPILLLVAAGAFVGILLGTNMSPLAPGAAGVVFLTIAAMFLFAPDGTESFISRVPGDRDEILMVPVGMGSAFLLGAALVVPLFSPTRWRGRPDTEIDDASVSLFGDDERDQQRALPPGRSARRDDYDLTGEHRVREARITSSTGEQRLSHRAERRDFRGESDLTDGTGAHRRYAEPGETRPMPRRVPDQRRGDGGAHTGSFPIGSGTGQFPAASTGQFPTASSTGQFPVASRTGEFSAFGGPEGGRAARRRAQEQAESRDGGRRRLGLEAADPLAEPEAPAWLDDRRR